MVSPKPENGEPRLVCKEHFVAKSVLLKTMLTVGIVVLTLVLGAVGFSYDTRERTTVLQTQVRVNEKAIAAMQRTLDRRLDKIERLLERSP